MDRNEWVAWRRSGGKLRRQVTFEALRHAVPIGFHAECSEVHRTQPGITAGVDAVEGAQVHATFSATP